MVKCSVIKYVESLGKDESAQRTCVQIRTVKKRHLHFYFTMLSSVQQSKHIKYYVHQLGCWLGKSLIENIIEEETIARFSVVVNG
jgi:hypothetical protein